MRRGVRRSLVRAAFAGDCPHLHRPAVGETESAFGIPSLEAREFLCQRTGNLPAGIRNRHRKKANARGPNVDHQLRAGRVIECNWHTKRSDQTKRLGPNRRIQDQRTIVRADAHGRGTLKGRKRRIVLDPLGKPSRKPCIDIDGINRDRPSLAGRIAHLGDRRNQRLLQRLATGDGVAGEYRPRGGRDQRKHSERGHRSNSEERRTEECPPHEPCRCLRRLRRRTHIGSVTKRVSRFPDLVASAPPQRGGMR